MDDYREEMLELRRKEILLGLEQHRRRILWGDIRLIIYLILFGVFLLTSNFLATIVVAVVFLVDLVRS